MKKMLNEIIGMDVEEAKELLEDNEILFQEKTKKKFSIKEKTGTIVKAEVDKETKEVVLYESNRGILVMPMLLVGLMLLGLSVTYGTGIYESIQEQILEIMGIGAPELEAEEGWGKTRLVKVVKDAKSSKKISHYI